MIRWLAAAACLVVFGLGVTPARAEKIVLRDARGEPDVADEATAVGFLIRSALLKDDRTLVGPVPADLTVASSVAAIKALHADHAVMVEVGREGTTLRATIAIVDSDGALIMMHANAGEGDVAKLAELAVEKIAGVTHAQAFPVAKISLGRLRPFAVALRTGDPAALVDGMPTTALAVPAIGTALAKLPPTALGGRAIANRAQLDAQPEDDVAAHIFAAIDRSDISTAEKLLGKPAKTEPGLFTMTRAMLADLRNDLPAFQRLALAGIGSDQPRAMLAYISAMPPGRASADVLRAALAAIDGATPTAGVVSRLGLLAAEAKIDGALDVILVKELDDAELARLIPLIEVDPVGSIIRLRAEVSMRRADGHQEAAIAAFLTSAPNDVRAHLYHGYVDMVTGKLPEAAAEFDTAGNQRLHTRALFVAKDLVEAAKGFDNKPASAEELAIAALLAKKAQDGDELGERADKLAPANPLVQRVVGLLAERRGDAARAKTAKQIADDDRAPAFALATSTAAPAPPPEQGKPAPVAPAKPPTATASGDDSGGPPVIPIAIASVVLVAGIVILIVARRRKPKFVPVPVSEEPVPLEQLVVEAPAIPEPEAEPFADFPFALDPETPPPEPEIELPPEDELMLAPPPEELVLEDVVPPHPIAVSFRAATPPVGMPIIPRTMTPLPAAGPIDLFEEPPVETMPGLILDRYRTTRELGRGAMGVVYRAWDTNLEREVAIKVMAEELRANPEALQLFTQEAKSLAQLNHANIVTIYDQVTINDKVYMIMELVDGTTLEHTLLDKKIYKWREALGLVDQLCAGLAYAHARKIIHRDIKPANIFMTTDGGVKLGDFGLARVMRELNFRATEVRGTPLYMAPEQITGTDIDHRTDLYAVGCTLYELITGRPPFVDGDILYQQVHTNPIPPSMLVVGLPQLLERLIMNLLSKQLEGRPRTANEVRSVLKSVS